MKVAITVGTFLDLLEELLGEDEDRPLDDTDREAVRQVLDTATDLTAN